MTSTRVLEMMERCDRHIALNHAITHLLHHVDPIWSPQYSGDTDAVFIMQSAMDGPPFVPEPLCEWEYPESSYGACDSLGACGKPADESGYCPKHRGENGL